MKTYKILLLKTWFMSIFVQIYSHPCINSFIGTFHCSRFALSKRIQFSIVTWAHCICIKAHDALESFIAYTQYPFRNIVPFSFIIEKKTKQKTISLNIYFISDVIGEIDFFISHWCIWIRGQQSGAYDYKGPRTWVMSFQSKPEGLRTSKGNDVSPNRVQMPENQGAKTIGLSPKQKVPIQAVRRTANSPFFYRFVLVRPSVIWIVVIHIEKCNVLYSVYLLKC